jgi:hypothetical protein
MEGNADSSKFAGADEAKAALVALRLAGAYSLG